MTLGIICVSITQHLVEIRSTGKVNFVDRQTESLINLKQYALKGIKSTKTNKKFTQIAKLKFSLVHEMLKIL